MCAADERTCSRGFTHYTRTHFVIGAPRQTWTIIGKHHMEKSHAGLLHDLPIGAGPCNELFLMALKDPGPSLKENDCCTIHASHSEHGQVLRLKIAVVVVHVFCNTERTEMNWIWTHFL